MKSVFSSIEGNGTWLDGGAMFGNAPRPMWEKWIKPDEIGRIPLASRGLLIETEGKRILCETGIGAFFEPKLAERYGVRDPSHHKLIENLRAAGIDHTQIDFVILSHLHFDHAGGLLPTYKEMSSGSWDLLFPNAKYVVGKEAWERAMHPHFRDRASFIPELNEKLKSCGRMILVSPPAVPKELPPGFEFFLSHGHTPGQLHTVFHGSKRSVVFCGDLIPGRAWVHLPITMGYDRFPELLIEEKQKLYENSVKKNWIFFYTHDAEVAASTIKVDAKGKFEPNEIFAQAKRAEL